MTPQPQSPTRPSPKIPVAILGATGSVGQRFVSLLADHPWFEITALMASERSAGRTYAEATRWLQASPLPPAVAAMPVAAAGPDVEPRLVFSALDASVAGPLESDLARRGHLVVTNTRNHRLDADVALLVPEVNAHHLELTRRRLCDGGAIVANPNCSTIGLVMALAPLAQAFGIDQVNVVTLQAISGAGYPGVASLEIMDNVIPFISGEEEKMESESRKVLGSLGDDGLIFADLTVSAQCNRVSVVDGHLECVSVSLRRPASAADIRAAWDDFRGEPQHFELPSAPRRPIHYVDGDTWPQPRLHRDTERGMAVVVGRLRPCPILDHKFVLLVHNTLRGAAGGAILCAELAVAKGLLGESG
ncbi:MAG: aspartate-semialdehyde dehydrogenase [Gemmatimonadetes bacterium]|nr:aspartate-semialdehyde dehydrogenase [Gemmatimonadota bacterium]